MGKFDAGQGNGRAPERLEASYHCSASAFDRSMILLNEIVEVLVTSHLNIQRWSRFLRQISRSG
jgi:hypothetical protein